MSAQLRIDLTIPQRQAYVKAVEMVLEAGKSTLRVTELHAVLMAAEPTAGLSVAGVYRSGVVFCPASGVMKNFPRASAIPQLMYSFMTAYRGGLRQCIPLDESQYEQHAWLVAATGRCLHPFVIGNTRLFCLIENHIRQAAGLPWTTEFRSKQNFLKFREMYQSRNQEFYDATTGAP